MSEAPAAAEGVGMDNSQASAKSAESAKTGTPAGAGSPSGRDPLASASRFKRKMTEDSLTQSHSQWTP